MDTMLRYKHYIRVNDDGFIVYGFSDAFEDAMDGDICIQEDGPRHFSLVWPEPLVNERGQYLYRWIDGVRQARSQDELETEWNAQPPSPPTEIERLRQEVNELTLMLGDVLLNGGV